MRTFALGFALLLPQGDSSAQVAGSLGSSLSSAAATTASSSSSPLPSPSPSPSSSPAQPLKTILHFSDVHLNISQNEQQMASSAIPFRYGDDAPLQLLESSLQFAKQVAPTPDVFLFTGDHTAHGLFTDDYIARAVETNVRTMEQFFPSKDVVLLEATAILGNADGNPDYHMEVTDPKETPVNPSIEMVSKIWNQSLPQEQFELFNRRGYLQYQLEEKLVLLTLNTVPYSKSHLPDTSAIPDPFDQFAWLRTTLHELRASGKYAYVAGHIAPMVDWYGGEPQWHEEYIRTYKAIAREFSDVIRGQFFGHVHSIEFRIPTLDENAEGSMPPLFISGSISPMFQNNPSFMVWKYHPETYEVHDFLVYGTSLYEETQELDWKLLFQATSAYDLPGFSSNELRDFHSRMEANTSLLEDYARNMHAHSPKRPPCNNTACHAKIFCTLHWWTTQQEYFDCIANKTAGAQTTNKVADQLDIKLLGGVEIGNVMGVSLVATLIAVLVVAVVTLLMQRRGLWRHDWSNHEADPLIEKS